MTSVSSAVHCRSSFRFVIVILCAFAAFFEFATRNNINNAIVSMVDYDFLSRHHNGNSSSAAPSLTSDYCLRVQLNEALDSPITRSSNVKIRPPSHARLKGVPVYEWLPTTQGLILGSFFYGYVVLQVPSGRIAEMVGGKWIVFVGIFGSGIINLLTPFMTHSIPLLTTSRVILGLIQGGVFPACFSLIVNWMPPDQRSLGFGLVNVGANLGTVFAAAVTGYISQNFGWPFSFFVIGGIATSWSILCWLIFVRNRPSQEEMEESTPVISKVISVKSLNGLPPVTPCLMCGKSSDVESTSSSQTDLSSHKSTGIFDKSRPSVPWLEILTNRAVVSAGLCRFVGIFGYLTLQTKLPAYLEDILHEPASTNGFFNSFLFLATALTMAFGPYFSEVVIYKGWLSRTTTRKVFSGTAQYGLVICLLLVPFVGCNAAYTVALLVVGMFLYGFVTGGDVIIPAEVSTHFPATIYSSINMFANLAGVISPMIVGMILEGAAQNEDGTNDLKSRWDWVFFMAAAIVSIGTTIFVCFGSSERQDFDRIEFMNAKKDKSDDNTSTSSSSSSL